MTRPLGLGEVSAWMSRWGEGMTQIAKKSRWTEGMNHRWGECLGEPRIPLDNIVEDVCYGEICLELEGDMMDWPSKKTFEWQLTFDNDNPGSLLILIKMADDTGPFCTKAGMLLHCTAEDTTCRLSWMIPIGVPMMMNQFVFQITIKKMRALYFVPDPWTKCFLDTNRRLPSILCPGSTTPVVLSPCFFPPYI